MARPANIVVAVASLVLLALGCARADGSENPPRDPLPALILWAWDRSEDLRFLDPHEVGVAFLAQTIVVAQNATLASVVHEQVIARPRLQPLQVPPGTALVAVVRIETRSVVRRAARIPISQPSTATDEQRAEVARRIADLQTFPTVRAIQIDFDARRSELGFYRALLEDVRKRLPATMPLSITALASWCVGDRWLDELPAGTIDEAVPMLFRMGPDEPAVASWLRAGRRFTVPACRKSLGVSTDEPLSQAILTDGRASKDGLHFAGRLYVFHPRPWKADEASALLAQRRRWNGR